MHISEYEYNYCRLSKFGAEGQLFFLGTFPKVLRFRVKRSVSRCATLCSLINLNYSRVEVAVDTRHRVCSRGLPLQMPCNEVDAVRSARLKGKECRHKIGNAFGKCVQHPVLANPCISHISMKIDNSVGIIYE